MCETMIVIVFHLLSDAIFHSVISVVWSSGGATVCAGVTRLERVFKHQPIFTVGLVGLLCDVK